MAAFQLFSELSSAYSPMIIHSPACTADCQKHAQITVGYNAQRDEEYKAA